MPYFAIGSAIYLAVIFSFIYRINDQKLIGCVSIIISRFTFLLPLRCTSNRRHWTCTRLDLQQAAHLRCTPWVLSSWYSLLTLIPSYTPWIAWNTRLQLKVNWYIIIVVGLLWCLNSCNVISDLCITRNLNLSIRFVYELLWDYSHFGLLICVFSWLPSPDGSQGPE